MRGLAKKQTRCRRATLNSSDAAPALWFVHFGLCSRDALSLLPLWVIVRNYICPDLGCLSRSFDIMQTRWCENSMQMTYSGPRRVNAKQTSDLKEGQRWNWELIVESFICHQSTIINQLIINQSSPLSTLGWRMDGWPFQAVDSPCKFRDKEALLSSWSMIHEPWIHVLIATILFHDPHETFTDNSHFPWISHERSADDHPLPMLLDVGSQATSSAHAGKLAVGSPSWCCDFGRPGSLPGPDDSTPKAA